LLLRKISASTQVSNRAAENYDEFASFHMPSWNDAPATARVRNQNRPDKAYPIVR
jgi:hypothetical protein